ncbi:MAG: DUF4412 domain-containing protein [Acidobacteria bacterium]|nr:DUF4412 domain-containing protein [Acidobacteriota bacterium]
MIWRIVLFVLVAVTSAASAADYSSDMVMLEDDQVMQTMRLFVSGQNSRVEGIAGPQGRVVTIVRKDKGVIWTLYPDRHEYTERPIAARESGQLDLADFDLARLPKETLGKEAVLGRACTKFRVQVGKMPNGQPLTATAWVDDRLGMPIRLKTMGIVQENRNLKLGAQPANLFEIPKGYAKADRPGKPPGMTPPRPGAAAPAHVPAAVAAAGSPVAAGSAKPARPVTKLEADALTIARLTSGEATPARFADDGFAAPGAFSGDRTLHWRNAEKGGVLEFTLPAEQRGRYDLALHLGKYRTFGQFQVLVNGRPCGAPIDCFGYPEKDEIVPFDVRLGPVELEQGDNRLALKLVGTNPDTVMPDHGACLDWVQLTYNEPVELPGAIAGTSDVAGGPAGRAESFEAETLQIVKCTSGEAIPRRLAEDGYAEEGAFTGDQSLQWHDAAEPGARLELLLPVEVAGRYAVSVRLARYRTYGIHQFLVNGKPLGQPVDMFGNPGHDIVTPFTVSLGETDLVAGNNRLELRLVGTNPETIMANHGAGLDWISVTPVGNPGAKGQH